MMEALPDEIQEIIELYEVSGTDDRWAAEQIIKHLGDSLAAATRGLKSAGILDLACGKKTSYRHLPPTLYEPWLSRIAVHRGFNVTGVDIEPGPLNVKNTPGTWSYHSADLLVPSALANFQNESFDVVALRGLVHTFAQSEIAPELTRISFIDEDTYNQKRDALINEVIRVLRKRGRLILNSFVLEKPDDEGDWDMIFNQLNPQKWELAAIKPSLVKPPFRTNKIHGQDCIW